MGCVNAQLKKVQNEGQPETVKNAVPTSLTQLIVAQRSTLLNLVRVLSAQ